jgi:tetratricopeptide (TPR) repeat protein
MGRCAEIVCERGCARARPARKLLLLGVALAHHRDLDAAAAKLKDANQRGPHWADPLKAWGDVLAQQGKIKDALAKYDQALKYAPNWKQLKKAREAAAKQKS